MSALQAVAAIVRASLDPIPVSLVCRALPHMGRDQVRKALQNAAAVGLVVRVSYGIGSFGVRRDSFWGAPGSKPAKVPENMTRPPASVWELARPEPKPKQWPPAFEGGRIHVLEDLTAEPEELFG